MQVDAFQAVACPLLPCQLFNNVVLSFGRTAAACSLALAGQHIM